MFIVSQLGKGRNNTISWHAGHHRRSNAHPTLALGSTLCRGFFTNPFFWGGRPDVHSFCSQTFPTASGDAPWTKSCSITSDPSQGTQPGQTSPCPCLGLGEQPPILPVALNLHLMQVSPSR